MSILLWRPHHWKHIVLPLKWRIFQSQSCEFFPCMRARTNYRRKFTLFDNKVKWCKYNNMKHLRKMHNFFFIAKYGTNILFCPTQYTREKEAGKLGVKSANLVWIHVEGVLRSCSSIVGGPVYRTILNICKRRRRPFKNCT